MANVYEQNLTQKSTLTTSDFIRVVGSDNVSYKQPVSEVLYAGGVRYKEFPVGTAFSDFADSCNIGITFSYLRYPTQSSDSPTSTNGRCAITVCKTYSDEITMSVTFFANATENNIYEKRKYGTWGSWVQLPTRAEVDALNSKSQKIVSSNTNITLSLSASSVYLLVLLNDAGLSQYRNVSVISTGASEGTILPLAESAQVTASISGLSLTITRSVYVGGVLYKLA